MKVDFITQTNVDGLVSELAIITNEDETRVIMLKSTYDEMIANQQNGTIS